MVQYATADIGMVYGQCCVYVSGIANGALQIHEPNFQLEFILGFIDINVKIE